MVTRGRTDADEYGVDFVIAGAERYVLVIEQREEWDGSERQQDDLVAKVGSYLNFVADKEFSRRYPDSKETEKPPEILLVFKSEPPAKLGRVIERLAKTVEDDGLTLTTAPLSP